MKKNCVYYESYSFKRSGENGECTGCFRCWRLRCKLCKDGISSEYCYFYDKNCVGIKQEETTECSWIKSYYDVDNKISNIFDEIDKDKNKNARVLANELMAEVGDFPDLQEAVALLDRFELLEDNFGIT